MHHVISMLLDNQSGALSRVVGLFSQRSYNIHSLNVAPIRDGTLSRLTLVVDEPDHKIEAIIKHVQRIIDVVNLRDLTRQGFVGAELLLVKASVADAQSKATIDRIVEKTAATVVDSSDATMTIQIAGTPAQLDDVLADLEDLETPEVVRSGLAAMPVGADHLEEIDYR